MNVTLNNANLISRNPQKYLKPFEVSQFPTYFSTVNQFSLLHISPSVNRIISLRVPISPFVSRQHWNIPRFSTRLLSLRDEICVFTLFQFSTCFLILYLLIIEFCNRYFYFYFYYYLLVLLTWSVKLYYLLLLYLFLFSIF